MRKYQIITIVCLAIASVAVAQTEHDYIASGDDKAAQLDFENAVVDYGLALGLNPDNQEALMKRGIANGELRMFELATGDLNKVIELNPENADGYVARGGVKLDQLNYHGAMQDYNAAIKLDPKNADAFNGRGDAKMDQKDYLGAIQDYDMAISFDQEDAFSYYARGVAKIKTHHQEEGCLDLSKSGELGYDEAYTSIKKLCKK